MTYTVKWQNTRSKEETQHGAFDSYDEAYQSILDWWAYNDFTPNYTRRWKKGNVTTIDYGSHHEFYKIVEELEKC
ncbi:hypothetical protein [Enterococcus faecalis]|uniref:hypothetical protein n=1 Tax=Enterococcus faecalis TaxID=1351 RepID=UPI001F00EF5E|nr:hypothetical protein [Enterococcus faecalis]HDT7379374.1 hypothetical protein [Enterococcus faecalis]